VLAFFIVGLGAFGVSVLSGALAMAALVGEQSLEEILVFHLLELLVAAVLVVILILGFVFFLKEGAGKKTFLFILLCPLALVACSFLASLVDSILYAASLTWLRALFIYLDALSLISAIVALGLPFQFPLPKKIVAAVSFGLLAVATTLSVLSVEASLVPEELLLPLPRVAFWVLGLLTMILAENASPTPAPLAPKKPLGEKVDAAKALLDLKKLYDEGILTKDEYEEKKKKYLAIL
jgi:small-conductance mechanosensitive channel